MTSIEEWDWSSFCGNVHQAIAPNAIEPCGKDADLRMYVDSNHAGDKQTRRSRTGFIIFLNMAPIVVSLRNKQRSKPAPLALNLLQ
jgi:hypothetical protein